MRTPSIARGAGLGWRRLDISVELGHGFKAPSASTSLKLIQITLERCSRSSKSLEIPLPLIGSPGQKIGSTLLCDRGSWAAEGGARWAGAEPAPDTWSSHPFSSNASSFYACLAWFRGNGLFLSPPPELGVLGDPTLDWSWLDSWSTRRQAAIFIGECEGTYSGVGVGVWLAAIFRVPGSSSSFSGSREMRQLLSAGSS